VGHVALVRVGVGVGVRVRVRDIGEGRNPHCVERVSDMFIRVRDGTTVIELYHDIN
jgi:hypothetical protein